MFFVRRRIVPTEVSRSTESSGQEETLSLAAFQRAGETSEDWLPTDALAYYVLDVEVLKGEVVDDSGLREYVEGGRWVLTSPNDPVLVLPALGLRSPRRFRDGHFGYDDFARWPQFFASDFEHHAFVPRFCERLARLWWIPHRDECAVIPGAIDRDVRVLNPAIVEELKKHCDEICVEVATARKHRQEDRAPLWITSMCDTLHRLSMGLSFRNIIHEVGEFQRHCLEIRGWLNLVNTFQPRASRDSVSNKSHHPVDKSIMGAFTHEVSVAQRLYRIGAPVYLIRHSSHLPPNMNVKESEPARPRRLALDPRHPSVILDDYHTERRGAYPFPVMPINLPGTRLQESLQKIRLPTLRGEQATAIGVREQKKRAGDEELARPEALTRAIPLTAYILTKKPIHPSSSITSFAIDPSLFAVQTIKSWDDALQAITKPYPAGLSSNFKGTALPNPSILANSRNRRLYVASWLAIRPSLIDRVAGAIEYQYSVFPTGQQWRNFLHSLKFHLDIPSSSSSKKHQTPSTLSQEPSAKRQRVDSAAPKPQPVKAGESSRMVEGQTILNSLPMRQERVTEVCWVDRRMTISNQEQLVREISDDIISEVTWDLHEHNFRFEFFMLDLVCYPEGWACEEEDAAELKGVQLAREMKLRQVFPAADGRPGSIYVTTIPNIDAGISSRSWEERRRYFMAFRELMLDWPECPDTVRNAPLTLGEFSATVLEVAVVGEYCARFLKHFGRPPIPPLRLPFASLRRLSPASFYAGLF